MAKATRLKTPSGTGGLIRKHGWPYTLKTFRTKRDAYWTGQGEFEDEMVRGVLHSAHSLETE